MGKKKKKQSVVPTYVFGLTWLACVVFFDWGIFKCLLVAFAAKWLASSILGNRSEKKKKSKDTEKMTGTPEEKPAAEQKQEEKAPEKQQNAKTAEVSTGNPELDAVIRDGRASVSRIQQINDDIPDFKISAQLKQIEILTASIIDQVEKKPDKLKEVRQFMNYYLPTTIKLLEQYVQMQNVGMRGENIASGMKQIEELLDKVIIAFQKQLDSLFERDVVDITADIQVMEQMMAAQGLTENSDFR